jgi:hypothetical protein
MIQQQLIESAKYIRTKFLKLSSELAIYHQDVHELTEFLYEKMRNLEEYSETTVRKIKNKDDIGKVTNHILQEIMAIEDEEKKLQRKVEKINIELEKLKKEEELLYKNIKERHPDLTDDMIIKEVQRNLQK